MASRNFRAWIFPILSLALGIGMSLLLLLWYDDRLVPFMGLLMGPPDRNSVPAFGIPALLAALFGFLRSKPREIWAYGLLMWAPQAIIFGGAFAFFSDGV